MYKEVFKNELGTQRQKYTQAKLRFLSPVQYHNNVLREKVKKELYWLIKEEIIESVTYSEWAAPVIPVVKGDGGWNFKVIINHLSKLESYPIPKVENLFTVLSSGKTFSKLNLSPAYQQLILAEESRKFTTISTHEGLFQ